MAQKIAKILVIDDDKETLELIETILLNANYDVYKATSGKEALKIGDKILPDVILLDIHMPEMDGYKTFQKFQEIKKLKNVPIIFITAKYLKLNEIVKGLNIGAYDYITKPFHNEELVARVGVAVKIKKYEDKILEQLNELKRINKKLKMTRLGIINALLSALELKDENTTKHCMRVTKYAIEIGKALNLSKEEIELLKQATLLHDIGKLGIDDNILKKPGKLNKVEFKKMKNHPKYGKIILNSILNFKKIIDIILCHHERVDGGGYYHTSSENIPLLSKIITVADAFDAMTSYRSYRNKLDYKSALTELEQNVDKQFDKDCVEALKKYLENKKLI